MKAVFHMTPINGSPIYSDEEGYKKYLRHMDGKQIFITMQEESFMSEKEKLMAFVRGPVLDLLIAGFRDSGYEEATKANVMHEMKKRYAMESIKTMDGEVEMHLKSLGSMNKTELWQFTASCCHFLEEHFGVEAPDAKKFLEDKD